MYSEHSGDRNQNPSPTGAHWPPQAGMAEAGRVARSGEGLAMEQFANLAASEPLTKPFLHPSFWGRWICMAGHHWVLFKVLPRILMWCLMLPESHVLEDCSLAKGPRGSCLSLWARGPAQSEQLKTGPTGPSLHFPTTIQEKGPWNSLSLETKTYNWNPER